MIYFFLYFYVSCFVLFITVLCLYFCFSDRLCKLIYYTVCCLPYPTKDDEKTPLIVESEYFPRPGYVGYCLVGQEDRAKHQGIRQEESGIQDKMIQSKLSKLSVLILRLIFKLSRFVHSRILFVFSCDKYFLIQVKNFLSLTGPFGPSFGIADGLRGKHSGHY